VGLRRVLEVVLDDDVGDGVKYELDVVGVRSAREVRVHWAKFKARLHYLKCVYTGPSLKRVYTI